MAREVNAARRRPGERRLRRSASDWSVRGVLAFVAVVLGYLGVTRSAGFAMRTDDPARAHALAPGDGRITGLYAQAVAGMFSVGNVTAADRARADGVAQAALRQDPTVVAAVSTLGLDRQMRGDVAGARRLFAYAERLSRRDLQTHVWAIEDAVGRGDVAGALRDYDVALRTSRAAPTLLFPILASAIADRPVRIALVDTLARQPAWGPHFISYAAGEGTEPRATLALLKSLRQAHVPVSDGIAVRLVDRLIGRNLLDDAWSAYAAGRGTDRRRSRDPRFAGNPATASAFDWRLVDTPGLTVSMQRGDRGGGIVDFSAAPGVGGPVLQQMQALPEGAYRLEGHAAGVHQPEGSRPYWSLTCRDGRELGRIAVPSVHHPDGVFSGTFAVPAGCPVQTLTLVIRPSEATTTVGGGGVDGQIDRAQLAPALPAEEIR